LFVTSEEIRTAAIELIGLRAALNHGMSETTGSGLCRRVIDNNDCDDLLEHLLEVFARAAYELRTPRGRVAVWLAMDATAEDESGRAEIRQAARLAAAHEARRIDIVASAEDHVGHESLVDFSLADRLADWGVAELDSVCTVVNSLSRVPETLVALVDLWLRMLPELAVIGADWLETLQPIDTT
jgi:hypothetical protein